MSYLIFCKERSDDGVACWWRPGRTGYTTDVAAAGRYSQEEAEQISRGSRGEDFPVPEGAIGLSIHVRVIVDTNDNGNWKILKQFELAAPGKGA